MTGTFRVTPLRPVRVAWYCDCRRGEMRYVKHSSVDSLIGLCTHECTACGKRDEAEKIYPCIEYRETPGEFFFEPAAEEK
jgi:hypothetical protein